jgi:hypothetical protein
MRLIANQETIDRLVEQGILFSEAFYAEYDRNSAGHAVAFLRGNFAGWRSTIHTLYHECAEQIVDRVKARIQRPIPGEEIESAGGS